MMSKGNFFFNERIKSGFPLVNEACGNVFIARSRLAFPQGLHFIYDLFKGKHISDVYAHPYFIEKQSNPDQPSPQLHLTEELQGCTRVAKSLMYMQDATCKLDNAMMVISDPTLLNAEGKPFTVLYNPVEPDEKTLYVINKRLANKDVQAIIVPSRQAYGQLRMWMERFPAAQIIASGNGIPESAVEMGLFDTVVSKEGELTGEVLEAKYMEDANFYRIVSPANRWDGERPFSPDYDDSDMVPAADKPSLDAKGKLRWDEAFGRAVDSIPLVHAGMHSGNTPNSNESSISATLKELAGKKDQDKREKKPASDVEEYDSAPLPEFVIATAAKREAYRARIQEYIDKRFTFVSAPSLKPDPFAPQKSFSDSNRPIFLTRNLAIQRVPGDDLTNELILMDRLSNSICCTDLFHGGYADFDPLNTWMCRVWFKFNRGGDYKDSRILPSFKRSQIMKHHGGMEEIQKYVASLGALDADKESNDVFSLFDRDVGNQIFQSGTGRTIKADNSKFHLHMVCHAHGTPPTIANARQLLLAQYDLVQCDKPHMTDRSIVEGMGIGLTNAPTMM